MSGLSFDALVCDLDGVIYRGDRPIEGAADAVNVLMRRGVRVLFATNNSRSTVAQYVAKLKGFGVDAEADHVLTSALVTAEVLERRGLAGSRAIVVGGDGLRDALALTGIGIEDASSRRADLVVVGWDPDFTYEAMKRAVLAIRQGAQLIAS